jgi:hypothetical protein
MTNNITPKANNLALNPLLPFTEQLLILEKHLTAASRLGVTFHDKLLIEEKNVYK